MQPAIAPEMGAVIALKTRPTSNAEEELGAGPE